MNFLAVRDSLANQPSIQGSERRKLLTLALDTWLSQILSDAVAHCEAMPSDFSLIAVGSYGRSEVTLNSDVDLMLLHRPRVPLKDEVASGIWYPIWDSGISLDHSVRTIDQARSVAAQDLKAMTGLLDIRHIGGNESMTAELRSAIHSDWRKSSKKYLPKLRELVSERRSRSGDLFQLLEPDIKESYGGLRDVSVLRALAATWQFEVMQDRWLKSSQFLLDLRDLMHNQSRGDRLRLQDQADIAQAMHFDSPAELLREVYLAGRSIAYASDHAWYQFGKPKRRRDIRRPLAEGVVSFNGEVVLARIAHDRYQPSVGLSMAAAAAAHELPISQALLDRYAEIFGVGQWTWTESMRESFVSLLGSRYGMSVLWESLDQAGVISLWMPEWESVRSLPQFNPLHEFTVDKHLIECVLNAQQFTRRVSRPDLLLLACLFHDIGKGSVGDHSKVGAEIVVAVMSRMGYPQLDIRTVELLVLHHLLLADTATRRDLEDPAVISELCQKLDNEMVIELLHYLSIADSRATGPSLRSQWRETLIGDAALKALSMMSGQVVLQSAREFDMSGLHPDQDGLIFDSSSHDDGYEILVGFADQPGLLSQVAGVLAINRLHVRAADVYGRGDQAFQLWNVRPLFGDLPNRALLRQEIKRALSGDIDFDQKLAGSFAPDSTAVVTWQEVSDTQTVIEVRARDRKGLLFDVTKIITGSSLSIVGARISTLGLEVVDVFFVRNLDGSKPSIDLVTSAARSIEERLRSNT